jgi:hypothetical protein
MKVLLVTDQMNGQNDVESNTFLIAEGTYLNTFQLHCSNVMGYGGRGIKIRQTYVVRNKSIHSDKDLISDATIDTAKGLKMISHFDIDKDCTLVMFTKDQCGGAEPTSDS